ncbi:hypothetical protein [uncultured Deefgea sp.]|uniref:hypothetical protein n=1 Tax=uncultured Deefgea sp. TaxID=1304914 RepID=UPI00263244D3|nr:hypothetical protein [uncultured Deefgea sp.]
MSDSESVSINLTALENLYGSQEYSVELSVTNISGKPISNLQVANTLSAGRELVLSDILNASNLNELEDKKRTLIKELESAVESAYGRHRRKNQKISEVIALSIVEAVDFYASIFSKRRFQATTPYWAEEAFKIDEWEDVERLEEEVISLVTDDSFLVKAYAINKGKLRRVLAKLEEEQVKAFSRGTSLPVGSTITFPFSFRAPHLLRQKSMDLSFKISYKVDDDAIHVRSKTTRTSFYPSGFAVPTGGMLGAVLGYAIKNTLISEKVLSMDWKIFSGSIILGLVISLIAARKPDSSQAITVEDFTGGLIIGALAGLYSTNILTKLEGLI